MISRRGLIPRTLPAKTRAAEHQGVPSPRFDTPRLVRKTLVDFSSLSLPDDARQVLAQAFWSHVGVRSARSIRTQWTSMLTFNRFATESGAIASLPDLGRVMLVRYIEWLNRQRRADGSPWTLSTRAAVYGSLRRLLQWLERCRPDAVGAIEYPYSPFPGRGRATLPRATPSAAELRAILHACEAEIAKMRAARDAAAVQRATVDGTPGSLGWLLDQVDRRFGGIMPSALELERPGNHALKLALQRSGGARQIEPLLYPRAVSLLPYYLAILFHTAGNPEPIAELDRDCLQALPLMTDRETLVWFKARAGRIQRRTFGIANPFEPPALVRDILTWNERLRRLAPPEQRNRLFLFKGLRTVNAMSTITVHHLLNAFCERHCLPKFALASIRPAVLSSFYRVCGDLLRTKAVANHASLATTVRYVETPAVQMQNRSRIAAVQDAFIGHINSRQTPDGAIPVDDPRPHVSVPPGRVVSMFGFDCDDPLAGVAPGTRRGELCTSFMGCFTCPNAIIAPDPATVARLLQARDHLRGAAATLHPARWQAFYAPQLRILEEDILPRFGMRELAAGQLLVARLPALPDLR